MRIKIVAAIFVVAALVVVLALGAMTISGHGEKTLDIKNEFEVGDYFTQNVMYKDLEAQRELKITGYDPITDMYTVEDKKVGFTKDPSTGEYVVKITTEIEERTAQRLITNIAAPISVFADNAMKSAVAAGYSGVDVKKTGVEFLDTEKWGTMKATKYRISYVGGDIGKTRYTDFWMSDVNVMLKQVLYLNGEKTTTLTFVDTNMILSSDEVTNPAIFQVVPEFEIGSSYGRNISSDAQTYTDELVIIDYNPDTGEYIVDEPKLHVKYNKSTGEFYPELVQETKNMTKKDILYGISPTVKDLEKHFYNIVENTRSIDASFIRVGNEFIDGDMFGNVKTVRYEGTMYTPSIDTTVKYVFWLGENNIQMKESMIFIKENKTEFDLSVAYTDMIIPINEN